MNDVCAAHGPYSCVTLHAVADMNLDTLCGVVILSERGGKPCMRSLACKSHSVKLKTSVQGRSRDFASLLADMLRQKEAPPSDAPPDPGDDDDTRTADAARGVAKARAAHERTTFEREFWSQPYHDVPDPPQAPAMLLVPGMHVAADDYVPPETSFGLARLGGTFTFSRGFRAIDVLRREQRMRRRTSEGGSIPPVMLVLKADTPQPVVVSHVADKLPLGLRMRKTGGPFHFSDLRPSLLKALAARMSFDTPSSQTSTRTVASHAYSCRQRAPRATARRRACAWPRRDRFSSRQGILHRAPMVARHQHMAGAASSGQQRAHQL